MDQRLWDSVGHQLARKGKEYRRRCIYRNRPLRAGDNVFTPACFPAAEDVNANDTFVIPELPRESLEEVCHKKYHLNNYWRESIKDTHSPRVSSISGLFMHWILTTITSLEKFVTLSQVWLKTTRFLDPATDFFRRLCSIVRKSL